MPPLPDNLEFPENYPEAIHKIRGLDRHARKIYPTGDWDEARWRKYLWVYYRLVEKVDREIGRLLRILEQQGLADNTVIVFASDHGEGMGAHRWTQKWGLVEEIVRVPLLVRMPGWIRSGVSDTLVDAALDLYPTFCEIAGAPKPANLRGRSLLPFLQDTPAAPERDHLVIETDFSLRESIPYNARLVHTGRYKYMLYNQGANREWLVDLQSDPGEEVNLAGRSDLRGVRDDLRAKLRQWAETMGDRQYAADRILAAG